MSTETEPRTYLTKQREGWTLINDGLPLVKSGSCLLDCLAAAARFKLTVSASVWLADLGRFGTMTEAKALR